MDRRRKMLATGNGQRHRGETGRVMKSDNVN